MALCLSFFFFLCFPLTFSLNFPRGEKIVQILEPGETFHFIDELYAGTSLKLDVIAVTCNTASYENDTLKLRWKIQGSTCFQGYIK